jgi:hypothetical protein
LFCVPKAAVLHRKSVGFAAQNSRFRNAKTQLLLFNGIIFTKTKLFSATFFSKEKQNCSSNKFLLNPFSQHQKVFFGEHQYFLMQTKKPPWHFLPRWLSYCFQHTPTLSFHYGQHRRNSYWTGSVAVTLFFHLPQPNLHY